MQLFGLYTKKEIIKLLKEAHYHGWLCKDDSSNGDKYYPNPPASDTTDEELQDWYFKQFLEYSPYSPFN